MAGKMKETMSTVGSTVDQIEKKTHQRVVRLFREHVTDVRVLVITDRTKLDEQIEKVFKGINEDIYRTRSGADLIATLNATIATNLPPICINFYLLGGDMHGTEPLPVRS